MRKHNKVVVTDYGFPHLDFERSILESEDTRIVAYQCKTEIDLIEACHDATAVLTQWAPITEKVIQSMKECKVIVRYGIGVDNVDLAAARKLGIPVVNVPDYAIDEVADHTFALLLSTVRKVPQVVNQVREGKWDIAPFRPIFGLKGKQLGLAGFGNIARAVAQRALAFGMEVAAYDPYLTHSQIANYGVTKLSWEDLLQQSDILSLHLPLNDETKQILNKSAFSRLKSSAHIINTSRGGIIDTNALVEALISQRIAGAAIDVLEVEPIPPNHPLLKLEQCLVTSHCAWYSEDSLQKLQMYAAEEVKRVLDGKFPKHIVNGVKL